MSDEIERGKEEQNGEQGARTDEKKGDEAGDVVEQTITKITELTDLIYASTNDKKRNDNYEYSSFSSALLLTGSTDLQGFAIKFFNSFYVHTVEFLQTSAKEKGIFSFEQAKEPQKDDQKTALALNAIAFQFLLTHDETDFFDSRDLTDKEKKWLLSFLDSTIKTKANNKGKKENREISYVEAVKAVVEGRKKNTKRKAEQSAGAITDIPSRVISITDKNYQHALTPYINKFAYIALVEKDFFSKLSFEGGKISYIGSDIGPAEIRAAAANGRKTEIVKTLDIQLLRTIFTAIYYNAIGVNGGNVTVYLPDFCKAMGVDMQTGKPNDIFGKINQFSTFLGYTDDGSFYKLLGFSKYDADANTITFDSPYMNMIIQKIRERNTITKRNGDQYLNPGCSRLVHTSIANERNKAAVEIVQIIVALLQQRGGKNLNSEGKRIKGEKVTGHKKFSAIVDEIPMLKDRIEEGDKSNINRQLSRAFKKAYELLRIKTDVYQYFVNLEISDVVPTATTLNKLILTYAHDGINPEYKQPK